MVVIFKKTACVLLFALLVLLNRTRAQQQTNYSLSDFVDSALHHQPVLLQKRALANAARAGITDARHAFLPNAFVADELTLGTDNSVPGSYLSFGIIPSTSSGLHSTNNYQSAGGNIAILESEYELADFGLRKATVKNAEVYADLSQADLDKETYLLKWQTGKLYFEILKNQFQLGIDLQNVSRYQAIFKVIRAVTRSGIRAGADSSLAMAELSESRTIYNQTYGHIRQLEQELSYLTGIPTENINIDTVEPKNYAAALDILARGIYPDTVGNPLVLYYTRQKQVYEQTEELVKKSFRPKIFLTGTTWARGSSIDYAGNYSSLTDGLGYQRFNYMAGATFVYDLFNGVHRRDKLTISHYNTIASDYNLQQQELSLQNVSNQADEAISAAFKNLVEIPIQIRASEDTYHQKTAQYKAGIINLIDLTNASFVLYRSQSDYIQTISDWLLANLDKAAATGNLDLFIQSIKK